MEARANTTPGATRGVFLTGATGFLGGEVLVRLLERGDGPIFALVRAESEEKARARIGQVLESLLGSVRPYSDRVTAIPGDVTQPRLGLAPERREWLAERVESVIHCAASVSFTLGLEESREINVEGTRRVLELAELCRDRGGLDYLLHVSTAYVAGTHEGDFAEADLDRGQGFRNAYERTKHETEVMLQEHTGGLPLQVVRPSIIVGDSRNGWTPAFNVLYGPLRAFSQGAFPLLPACSSSPVDVVPVDYVADAIVALAGRPGTTYHLTAGANCSSVAELVELGSAHTGQRPPVIVPPRLYRRAIHPLLVRVGNERRRRALRRSEVYFPYFEMKVRYANERTRAALEPLGIEAPPLGDYFGALLEFAEAAEWGRRPLARAATMKPGSEPTPRPRARRRERPRSRGASAPAPRAGARAPG